jgi:hypothetical protein
VLKGGSNGVHSGERQAYTSGQSNGEECIANGVAGQMNSVGEPGITI